MPMTIHYVNGSTGVLISQADDYCPLASIFVEKSYDIMGKYVGQRCLCSIMKTRENIDPSAYPRLLTSMDSIRSDPLRPLKLCRDQCIVWFVSIGVYLLLSSQYQRYHDMKPFSISAQHSHIGIYPSRGIGIAWRRRLGTLAETYRVLDDSISSGINKESRTIELGCFFMIQTDSFPTGFQDHSIHKVTKSIIFAQPRFRNFLNGFQSVLASLWSVRGALVCASAEKGVISLWTLSYCYGRW